MQTTGNCVAFGRGIGEVVKDGKYTEAEMALVNRVLPLIVATIDDRSWRVRWTAASKFADVIAAFDSVPDAMDSLVPSYEKLLQDPEAEVSSHGKRFHIVRCVLTMHVFLVHQYLGSDCSNVQSCGCGQL